MSSDTLGFSTATKDFSEIYGDFHRDTLPLFIDSDSQYDSYFKNANHYISDDLLFDNSSDILDQRSSYRIIQSTGLHSCQNLDSIESSQIPSVQQSTEDEDSFDCDKFLFKHNRHVNSINSQNLENSLDNNLYLIVESKTSKPKKSKKVQTKRQTNQGQGKKNREQALILDSEYEKNPVWSRSKMEELGKQLGLTVPQVYKWHWDRKQTIEQRFKRSLEKISTTLSLASEEKVEAKQQPCIIFRIERPQK